MNGVWTLLHNGTEKTLAAWGLRATRLMFRSQSPDSLELIAASQSTRPPTFAADDKIELFLQTDPDDADTKVRKFTGWMDTKATQERAREGFKGWVFTGPWRWLERAVFEQTWARPNPPGQTVTFTTERYAHCYIPQRIVANTPPAAGFRQENITTGEQMRDALEYCLELATLDGLDAPFTIAASFDADVPDLRVPIQEVQNIYCSEVIRRMWAWSPGTIWFDHSTSPPTVYAKPYDAQSTISIDLTDAEQGEYEVNARYDLVHDAVSFTYEQTRQDGSWTTGVDTWPPSANPRGFRTLRRTFNFQGPSGSTVAVTLDTANYPTTAAGWATWLQSNHPIVAGGQISNLTVKSPLPSPTYVRQLTSGVFPDWLEEVSAAPEVLRLKVSYRELSPTNEEIRVVTDREIAVNVTSTNGQARQYTRVMAYDAGDPLPDSGPGGLANQVYDWVSVLPYEGTIVRTAQEYPSDLTLGVRLNLTGGDTAWASMASAIHTIDIDINTGTVRAEFGPPEYLGPQDRITLLSVTRGRLQFTAAVGQASGFASAGSIETGAEIRGQAGDGGKQLLTKETLGETNTGQPLLPRVVVQADQTVQQVQIVNAASAPTSPEQILLKLSEAFGRNVKLRIVRDNCDGVQGYRIALCSEKFTTLPPGGALS